MTIESHAQQYMRNVNRIVRRHYLLMAAINAVVIGALVLWALSR